MTAVEFGGYIVRWPASLESLVLCGQNNTDWRSHPHEVFSEKDAGAQLCRCLRNLSPHLRHLSVRNLIKIRELLGPVWPAGPEDRGITPLRDPDIPVYRNLETVDFHYASLNYRIEWYKDTEEFNDQEVTRLWRQNVAFAAARLAAYMPRLRRMTVTQREGRAEVVFSSSIEFKPREWVVAAWAAVAKRRGLTLVVRTEKLAAVSKDGSVPVQAHIS